MIGGRLDVGKPAEMYKPMSDGRESLARESDRVVPMTVSLSDCTLPEFMDIAARFGSDEYAYAVTPNVDHLIRYCDDPTFRDLYRSARYLLLDSRFLARILRFATGADLPTCPGSDVTAHLFSNVIRPDDKLVLIGSSVAQADLLRKRHGLNNLAHFNPAMGFINDAQAVEATLRFIEEQSPFRFCLLAVGCPQQEFLARALKTRGHARGLALCIGASINFITGGERRAPRWVGALGLEWLFRLLQNPVRLSGRYLLRGPRIFLLLPRLKFQLRSPDSERP
jgi:exopolysaccharide biosynthesis WecB/TagA/CpsF family protein